MFFDFGVLASEVLEVVSSAFVWLTNGISMFIIYLKRLNPFFTFCYEVYDSMPDAFKHVMQISFIASFIVFLFISLRRGK